MALGGCAGRGVLSAPKVEEDTSARRAMRYFVKAKVYEFQGNHLGAIVALRSAADLDPTSATIYTQLALMYERIQDWSMAAAFARAAGTSFELNPKLWAVSLRRAYSAQYRADLPG